MATGSSLIWIAFFAWWKAAAKLMNKMKLSQVDLPALYEQWVQGAGPFACFVRKTNFVSLKHYRDFDLQPVVVGKSNLFKQLEPELRQITADHLLLFDITAVEGMRLGYLLQNRLQIKPILTYVSPLHTFGLVGGDRYVNALIGYGLRLEPVQPRAYVFVLDRQRYRSSVSRQLLQKRFNNQYELTADDLPNIDMLQDLGYKRVSLYRQRDAKDDVKAYLQYLQEQRFEVVEIEISK